MRRLAYFTILMALAASSAAGYYHFVHYPSSLGPYTPIYEKFDLNALVNKTVYVYVTDERPTLAPSDSYESFLGQVRQAAAVWNGVATSDLRVGFGGVANLASSQAQTPGVEIVFGELAPGINAFGGPTVRSSPTGGFIPIVRSQVILPRDLSKPDRTTASEYFFNTLVHEMGHTLGLQHSATGSVMSIEPIRSTSRARPLGTDDMAGLSLLYPAPGFAASAGSITGRVINNSGRGLHMVSVVAVSPSGAVISGLTAPDGAYRIDGVPAGSYFVYAHSMSPATLPGYGPANIVLPKDGTGADINASGPVETQFFGGVKDPNISFPVLVNAGASSDGVDFRLAERSSLQLYDVTTYGNPGNGAPLTIPAFVNTAAGTGTVWAFGQGLSQNMRNVTVGVLGGGVQLPSRTPLPYASAPSFAQIDLEFTPVTGTGPRHLFFALNGDVYVRAAAVQLVARPAPLVRDVQTETDAAGNIVLVLSGDNFAADSRVFLDGAAASVRSFDDVTGKLRVTAPPGPGGRQAVITVYNSDGQSSVFVQPSSPATYTYPPSDAPSFNITPATGRAGRDVMVEIQGTNTNFADGQTVVGFGTSDIVTRRVWVLSPTRLQVVISISPRAALTASTVSVVSGTQLASLPAGFRVDAAATSSTTPIIGFQGLVNTFTFQPRLAPGSLATLFGSNLTLASQASANAPLPTTLAGSTVTLNDRAVPLQFVSAGQINLQLPFSLTPGPAILRVSNGLETSAPMVVQIDSVAPGLIRATTTAGIALDANTSLRLGDTMLLFATGLGAVTPPATAGVAASALATTNASIRVNVGGVDLVPAYAGLAPGFPGLYQINVPVPPTLSLTGPVQVYLTADGQASNSLTIGVRN